MRQHPGWVVGVVETAGSERGFETEDDSEEDPAQNSGSKSLSEAVIALLVGLIWRGGALLAG